MELFSQNNHHQKQTKRNTRHMKHKMVSSHTQPCYQVPSSCSKEWEEKRSWEQGCCLHWRRIRGRIRLHGTMRPGNFLKIVEYVTILTTNLKSCIVVSIKSKSCQQLFTEYSIKKQHWNTINTVCMQYSQSGKSFFYACLLNVSQIERLTNNTKQGKTVGRYWKFQIPKAWEEKQSQC